VRVLALALVAVAAFGCSGRSSTPPPSRQRTELVALSHDAYVWQRAWTGSVRAAVANAPAELSGLRVLTLEVSRDGTTTAPAVDTASLVRASRPITAVVRIDGSRLPVDLTLVPVLERIDRWRQAGVAVAGVEIDHDCATAALTDYTAWLTTQRPAGLRFSITALPTWATAPSATLADLAAAVDEIVLQVHAVRAPTIFDARSARRWVEQFAAAVPSSTIRVALPTYKVALGAARPTDVAAFLRSLEHDPVAGVTGIVWFRLPVATDRTAWPAPVLAAVIQPRPSRPGSSGCEASAGGVRGAPHSQREEPSHVR